MTVPTPAQKIDVASAILALHDEGCPMLSFLSDLAAHSEWANAVFFHAWGKSPAREHEEMRQRVVHILGVQQGFVSILRGQAAGGPPGGPPPSFADLKARAVTGHADLREFVATLTPDGLARTVQIPWFPDPPCVITVGEAWCKLRCTRSIIADNA